MAFGIAIVMVVVYGYSTLALYLDSDMKKHPKLWRCCSTVFGCCLFVMWLAAIMGGFVTTFPEIP